MTRERLELPDGDFLDIDWTTPTKGLRVLLLHGLEGSLDSHYTGGLLDCLKAHGYTAGLMYFRGRSGEPNRLARSYHSGDTGDLDYVVRHLQTRHPQQALALVGFSLGGNVLLKWLGEQGTSAQITTAVAVSVPFDLDAAARQLDSGLSRIYRRHLLSKLRESIRLKANVAPVSFPLSQLSRLRTFHAFDNAITAPLHGFKDVYDYYQQSSSKQFLAQIRTPTLILQSVDDPFLPPGALPGGHELSDDITLELSSHGGHVGFVAGNSPGTAHYWLEQRIVQHLAHLH